MPDLVGARWVWTGASWICYLLLTLWLLALLFPAPKPRERMESTPEKTEGAGARRESSDAPPPAGLPAAEPTHPKEHP